MSVHGNFFKSLKQQQENLVVMSRSSPCMQGNQLGSNPYGAIYGNFVFQKEGSVWTHWQTFNSIWSKQKESLLSWLKSAFWVLGRSKSAQMLMYELQFDIFSSRRILCKQLMHFIAQKIVAENTDRGGCTERTQRPRSGKGRKLVTVIMPLWKAF